MKKVLLLIILAIGGYQLYQHKFNTPYLGEWHPDIEKFMATAVANGATEAQKPFIQQALSNTKVSITKDKFTFTFPNLSGGFDYKVEKQADGCFHFTIDQAGGAVGCINDNELALTLDSNRTTEYFIKQ